MHRIGIIGGSGLYELPGLVTGEEVALSTPFGAPSDALMTGTLGDAELVFLPRHGRGHRLTPTEVPYRANIWALKKLGADWCISVSAVGSLREEIVPGHVVIIDQFIDRTKGIRDSSFFGDGIVGHVAFGDPVSPVLADILYEAAVASGGTVHRGGTYVCMEGPAFSTRAESELYRSWGASVIGMTNVPESKLAREAEIAYATVAMATDYDCWHPGHDDVSVAAVIETMNKNVSLARNIIRAAAPKVPTELDPLVAGASQFAVMTAPDRIPAEQAEALAPIIGKYLS